MHYYVFFQRIKTMCSYCIYNKAHSAVHSPLNTFQYSYCNFLFRGSVSWRDRRQLLPPREEKTCSIHQAAAKGAGTGVCRQQVYHQGQTQADIRSDQPVWTTGHYLVPEPKGKGEKSRQQIKKQQLAFALCKCKRTTLNSDGPHTLKAMKLKTFWRIHVCPWTTALKWSLWIGQGW